MRRVIAALAVSGVLLGTGAFPTASQMLNDPPRDPPGSRAPSASSEKAKAEAHPARPALNGVTEIEIPGSAPPSQAAGWPAGMPLTGTTPFNSGETAQQMGLYRALTK